MLLLITLVALPFGVRVVGSTLAGGGIALLANGLFAWVVFTAYQAAQPGRLVARFYAAEALKLLFVALAFAALFIWMRPLNIAALFVAFFMVQVVAPLTAHLLARET